MAIKPETGRGAGVARSEGRGLTRDESLQSGTQPVRKRASRAMPQGAVDASTEGVDTAQRAKGQKKAAVPVEPKRAFAARSLAALMPDITRPAFRRRSPIGVRVFTEWAEIIGAVNAARTSPRKLLGGTLTIACTGPTAMELQHLVPELMSRINTWCGEKLVERIRFTQDIQLEPVQPVKRVKPLPPEPLPDFPEGSLKEALEALGARIRERKR